MTKNKLNSKGKINNQIMESQDYGRFIENKDCKNYYRAIFLVGAYRTKNIDSLPLVEVKEEGNKLRIIGDQDSFMAAELLGIPVRFYKSIRSAENQYQDPYFKQKLHLDSQEYRMVLRMSETTPFQTKEDEGLASRYDNLFSNECEGYDENK